MCKNKWYMGKKLNNHKIYCKKKLNFSVLKNLHKQTLLNAKVKIKSYLVFTQTKN